jgi:hypothetical protein
MKGPAFFSFSLAGFSLMLTLFISCADGAGAALICENRV